jgi:hypothetical protein
MSALPPKADIAGRNQDVCFVPKADILRRSEERRYSITSSARARKVVGRVRPQRSRLCQILRWRNALRTFSSARCPLYP